MKQQKSRYFGTKNCNRKVFVLVDDDKEVDHKYFFSRARAREKKTTIKWMKVVLIYTQKSSFFGFFDFFNHLAPIPIQYRLDPFLVKY